MNIVERYLYCFVNYNGVPKYKEMYEASLYAIKIRLAEKGSLDDCYFIAKDRSGFANSIIGRKIMRQLVSSYPADKVIVVDGEIMERDYHSSYMTMKSRIMDAVIKQIIVK